MTTRHFFTRWTARLALSGAAGFASCSLHAQGTISATATLSEVGQAGSEFEYSLSLDNTGTVPINALWYGWIRGSFDLPSIPSSITGPSGWTGSADGDSIQFGNSTGSAIAPGTTGTFTFESTSSPTAMTTGTTDGAPTGDSIAYSTVGGMSSFDQSDPGKATGPFQATLTSVPEPSTVGLMVTGLGGMTAWMARRRSKV